MTRLSMDLKVMLRSYIVPKFILAVIDEGTNFMVTTPFSNLSEKMGDASTEHEIGRYSIPEYKIIDQERPLYLC